MIDNVILLTLGTLHERDTHELLDRCHPLGVFDTMPALCVATNVEELYHSVLVETPLGGSADKTGFRRDGSFPFSHHLCPFFFFMQHPISAIVSPLKISMTSILKSFETRYTNPTSKISTRFAPHHSLNLPARSCVESLHLKPIDEQSTSLSTLLAPNCQKTREQDCSLLSADCTLKGTTR